MPPSQHSPVTPSPHRFLPSRSSSEALQPKKPPTLRSRLYLQTPHQPQQFALTPRFSSASFSLKPGVKIDENGHHSSAAPPSSSPGIPRPRPRLPVYASAEIEEGNSDKGEDEAQEAADDDDLRAAGVDQKRLTSTALYSSPSPARKRRRRFKPVEPMDPDTVILSSSPTPSPSSHEHVATLHTDDPGDDENPSSQTSFVSPSNTTAASAKHPRFRSTLPSPPTSHVLPKFLLPDPPSPPPLAPPHAFSSPQRRTTKFVPGGLAATMRDLVVEKAMQQQQPIRASRNPSGMGMVAGWDFQVRVRNVRTQWGVGAGMVLLREQVDDVDGGKEQKGEGKGWLLVGPGTGRRTGAVVGEGIMREGDVVGVKRPVWEMDVAGELWTVGVEWVVLQ